MKKRQGESPNKMKIALVHDWLVNLSGAERVLSELHKIFPEAPIYILFGDKKFVREYLPDAYVQPSFLQLIPGITKLYRKFLFLMPIAIESFDLSGYDVVISSSAVFSKGLVLKPKTRHICYCYSPTRQIWDLNTIQNSKFKIQNSIGGHFLRLWDRHASDRVDEFIAISEHVRQRIRKYYRRDAVTIYPPISLTRGPAATHPQGAPQSAPWGSPSRVTPRSSYYLIVSRLYKHKNIDVAIEAFNKLNLPLLIIGTGPEKEKLKNKIEKGKDIKLLGFISDEELPDYYQNCRAFIMPQEEDFGLTPIEAMSYGKPVLALRKGGAIETIIENKTGEFFDDPIPEALADGVRRLNENYSKYDSGFINQHVQKFSADKFCKEITELVYNN